MTESAVESLVELRVLLGVLSGSPETAGTRALLDSPVRWPALLELADKHGVVPLLFRWLRTYAPDLVPPEPFAVLRNKYQANVARSLQLTHELAQIVQTLAAADLAAICLRGPTLALQAYGDPTLRQFSDLDLLVRPEDLPAAFVALDQIGYKSSLRLSRERLPQLRRALPPTLEVYREGCLVELHTAAMEWGRRVDTVPSPHWWEATETIELYGHPYLCLSRVNNLLLASIHGSEHRWRVLKWIADLSALLAAASDQERTTLLQYAQEFGLLRMVLYAVELAEALRHQPERILHHLGEVEAARPGRLETILGHLAGGPDLARALMDMRSFLRLKDQRGSLLAVYLSRILVPRTEDLASVALPPWLTPLHYPLRAARLVGRAVRKVPSLFTRSARREK
jgi:hypothetical protein